MENAVLFQKSTDSLTATWLAFDGESQVHSMQYAVGSYPEASDIFPWTALNKTAGNSSVIPNGLIKPKLLGMSTPLLGYILHFQHIY